MLVMQHFDERFNHELYELLENIGIVDEDKRTHIAESLSDLLHLYMLRMKRLSREFNAYIQKSD